MSHVSAVSTFSKSNLQLILTHEHLFVLQLMEMILGALGRDAIGLGAGMAHPRESDEWKTMTLWQK